MNGKWWHIAVVTFVAVMAVADPASAAGPVQLYLEASGNSGGCILNHYPDTAYYNYQIGATVSLQGIIQNDNPTPIAGAYFDFVVDDDYLLLVCDPASVTLPAGAVLTLCDPGPGLPANGHIRVDVINVPPMDRAQVEFKAKISPTVPAFRDIFGLARMFSTSTGQIWSNPGCCGSDPGIATVIRPFPAPPDWMPVPLNSTLAVSDLDGGTVLPSDTLRYRARLLWWPCGNAEQGMINLVAPLPPGVDFVGFTSCAADVTCFYDPTVRRVFVDTTLPHFRQIDAEVEFDVTVRAGTTPGSRLCMQGVVNGDVLSDDPDDAVPLSATCVNVGGNAVPALSMFKTIAESGDDDGVLERGETARFELEIHNHSLTGADDVHVLDVLPVGLTGFDPAAVVVTPAAGTNLSVAAPAGLGSGVMEWTSIRVPGQSVVRIVFDARVAVSFAGNLCNAAEATSATWALRVPSDDPATTDPEDPTCVAVVPPRLRASEDELLGGCDMSAISAGAVHSLGVRVDGRLATWGDNRHGQLGDGGRVDSTAPLPLDLLAPGIAVAAGRYHSVAASSDGRAWAWGDNTWGQLGSGTFADFLVPVEVPGVTGVTQVAAGYFHSLALKSDGTVWAWGYNREGQLGNGTTTTSTSPARAGTLTNVVEIAAGAFHSLARDGAGNVWAWGDNEWGQLGLGHNLDQRSPVRVTALSGAIHIASRCHHVLAALASGSTYAWGWNEIGQLGVGSTPAPLNTPTLITGLPPFPADSLAAGTYHSLASIAGALYAWGDDIDGMLGAGSGQTSTPVLSAMGAAGWSTLAAGDYHSLAIRPGGFLWAWGRNSDGQLGRGSTSSSGDPVLVSTACAPRLTPDPARAPAVADACAAGGGNGDGYAEPGEQVSFEVGVRNVGDLPATGFPDILGVLLGPAPAGVTYLQDRSLYVPSPLPAGSTGAPNLPFLIELASDIVCPRTITLSVDIVSAESTVRVPFTFDVGPCAPQCQAIDCQPLLQKVTLLQMVRTGTAVDATWTSEASATSGYALWSVATKNLIPLANQATTTRTAECTTPDASVVQCLGATPVGTTPGVLFYQVLGVCGVGLEGPL